MTDYLILVNKDHPLDKNFVPEDLVEINEPTGTKVDSTYVNRLNKEVYAHFKKMQEAALKEGYQIFIDSSYRTYEYQQVLFDDLVSKKGLEYTLTSVAKPGCSEHQTGLAIDILFMRDGVLFESFEVDEPEIVWAMNNAYKFGFILRYPKDKEDVTGFMFEPWHYRYVGEEVSRQMHEKNILTLEELLIRSVN